MSSGKRRKKTSRWLIASIILAMSAVTMLFAVWFSTRAFLSETGLAYVIAAMYIVIGLGTILLYTFHDASPEEAEEGDERGR